MSVKWYFLRPWPLLWTVYISVQDIKVSKGEVVMPSDPVAPKSAFTTNKYEHPRSKALKDGIVKLHHDQALKTDTINVSSSS